MLEGAECSNFFKSAANGCKEDGNVGGLLPGAGRHPTSISSPFFAMILLWLLAAPSLFASEENALSRTDEKTALMWQDVPQNKGAVLTWQEAKEYCEALGQEGYDDWWLPSESELATIVNLERPEGRRIKTGFTYYRGSPYWTSSTYAWNAPHAWVVDFGSGSSYTLEKSQRCFVRCVRCSDFKACLQRFYNSK